TRRRQGGTVIEPSMTQRTGRLVRRLKALANGVALVLVFPCAATCWLESKITPSAEGVFSFWTHVFALVPGLPGLFLRRAFYRHTLTSCSPNCDISFGCFFSHRAAHVADDVYLGPYAVVGRARLGKGCLIGTRVSLLSGPTQHEWLEEHGFWTPSDVSRLREVEVGAHAWIGEAATIMADVGAGSLVAAGAVVSSPVPEGVVVAGTPARFVRRVSAQPIRRDVLDGQEAGA